VAQSPFPPAACFSPLCVLGRNRGGPTWRGPAASAWARRARPADAEAVRQPLHVGPARKPRSRPLFISFSPTTFLSPIHIALVAQNHRRRVRPIDPRPAVSPAPFSSLVPPLPASLVRGVLALARCTPALAPTLPCWRHSALPRPTRRPRRGPQPGRPAWRARTRPRLARSLPSRPRSPRPGARPACLRCTAGARLARPWGAPRGGPRPPPGPPPPPPPRPPPPAPPPPPARLAQRASRAPFARRGSPDVECAPAASARLAACNVAARGDPARPARSTPALPLAVAPCVVAPCPARPSATWRVRGTQLSPGVAARSMQRDSRPASPARRSAQLAWQLARSLARPCNA
jgi:hypothetical protein